MAMATVVNTLSGRTAEQSKPYRIDDPPSPVIGLPRATLRVQTRSIGLSCLCLADWVLVVLCRSTTSAAENQVPDKCFERALYVLLEIVRVATAQAPIYPSGSGLTRLVRWRDLLNLPSIDRETTCTVRNARDLMGHRHCSMLMLMLKLSLRLLVSILGAPNNHLCFQLPERTSGFISST